MNKDYFIELTSNVYRLTLLFPKKEPLRYKLRELSNEVLSDLISTDFFSDNFNQEKTDDSPPFILENLKVLDGFFEVAKNQNWVSSSNILNLQQEYSKLNKELEKFVKNNKDHISKIPEKKKETSKNTKNTNFDRQIRILEILKEKEKAQVGEVKEVFSEITKRTLRRDFEFLLKKGLIERMGERNNTFYKLKG